MQLAVGLLTLVGPLFVGWPVGAIFYLLVYSLALASCVYSVGTAWVGVMIWLVYLSGIVVIFLFFAAALPAPSLRGPAAPQTALVVVLGAGLTLPLSWSPNQPVVFALAPLVGGGEVIVWLGGALLVAILICSGVTQIWCKHSMFACRAEVAILVISPSSLLSTLGCKLKGGPSGRVVCNLWGVSLSLLLVRLSLWRGLHFWSVSC